MVLDDTAQVRTEGGVIAGTARCAFVRKTSDVVTSDVTGAVHPVITTTILLELPLADAGTGAPLSIDADDVQSFIWRGRSWSVLDGPVIYRQHGADHHAGWTLQRGPAIT